MLGDLLQRKPYNAVTDFVDAPVARGLAEKIAFIDAKRSLSYGELQKRTCRFATALADLGLKPEERLALLLYDTIDFPVAFWGTLRAGIVALPLNTLLTAEQYAYILADSRASAIVVAAPLAKTLVPILDRLPRLRQSFSSMATRTRAPRLPRARFAILPISSAAEQSKCLPRRHCRTKSRSGCTLPGSTGEPKGVKHIHTTPMAAARLMGHRVIGIREDDVVFSAAKLLFSYGMGNAMAFPDVGRRYKNVAIAKADPEAVFEVLRRHQPTVFFSVPTLFAMLLAHKDTCRGAGSDRLRLADSAGEALPAPLGERWRATAGVDVLDGIGSTEMFQTFLSNQPGDVRFGTTGKPVPGYELKIVDEHGTAVADGEIGGPLCADRPPAKATGTSAPRAAHLRWRVDLHRR